MPAWQMRVMDVPQPADGMPSLAPRILVGTCVRMMQESESTGMDCDDRDMTCTGSERLLQLASGVSS